MDRWRALLRWSKGRSTPTCYALATLVILAAFAVRWVLDRWLAGFPFVLFFPAVAAVALVIQRGTGFYATILSAVLAIYFLIEPPYSFALSPADTVGVFIFIVSASLITVLAETFRSLSDQLDDLERQKTTLLHELNHRTRNNLQIISSTLAIEGAGETEPRVRQVLQGVAERVGSIGRLQHHLFALEASETIDAGPFIRGLCGDLEIALVGQRPVAMVCEAGSLVIDRVLAGNIGIIVNELMTNALKHAFPEGRGGYVQVRLQREPGGNLLVLVSDNGLGCAVEKVQGTGTTLVTALVDQLGGSVEWQDAAPGCRVAVRIPASRVRGG